MCGGAFSRRKQRQRMRPGGEENLVSASVPAAPLLLDGLAEETWKICSQLRTEIASQLGRARNIVRIKVRREGTHSSVLKR